MEKEAARDNVTTDIDVIRKTEGNALVFNTPNDILEFGNEATVGISKFSDEILSQVNLSYTNESSRLLKNLNSLMERFDKSDFTDEEKENFIKKLFNRAKKSIDAIYEKYTSFSKEVDKIFIEIKKYELEVKESNDLLLGMYDKNMDFYSQLDGYVMQAQEYISKEVNPKLEELEAKVSESGDGQAQLEIGKLAEVKEIMEQRIYDLELAKAVSLQTAPQIKLIQKGNYNLSRKINSAFVITLPLFKQEVIQAITIKRQKIQMDSMSALDESTNKLLKQNAQNIVANTKRSVEFNRNSAVRIETLEQSYNTIINGIKEVEDLEAENKAERQNSIKRLEELRQSLISGKPIELKDQE